MSAIGMKLIRESESVKPLDSHFYGNPAVPAAWAEEFDEDTIFFCQIKLSDIAAFDCENKLPHCGYLYVFIDTYGGSYDLEPIVMYSPNEPDTVLLDFNKDVEGYERFTAPLGIEFFKTEEDADCQKLLGVPCDWNYEEPAKELLMQINHMDDVLNFHWELDGYSYLFFGSDRKTFEDITIFQEYS